MALPIYGPVSVIKSNSVDRSGSYLDTRNRYRQTKPYNLPLPYTMERVLTTLAILRGSAANFGNEANAAASSLGNKKTLHSGASAQYQRETDIARNICFQQTRKAALAANVELGINLVQRKQAIDMLLVRGKQLLTILNLIRRGRINAAAHVLMGYAFGGDPKKKRPPPPNLKDGHKGSANALLEWQFGWMPLAESCYNAMVLYNNPVPGAPIHGKGKQLIGEDWSYTPNKYVKQTSTTNGFVGVGCKGVITIADTDQYLVNRLGIANPASVAWDAIPGSFVIDWFVNVKQFLDAATDFYGVNTSLLSTTTYWNFGRTGSSDYDIGLPSTGGWTISGRYARVERTTGLPPVRLVLKPLRIELFHVRTTWALVVQRLR